jgi:hypothetical protein
MQTSKPSKNRKLVFVCVLYAALSLLMVAFVAYMAKYMDQN